MKANFDQVILNDCFKHICFENLTLTKID